MAVGDVFKLTLSFSLPGVTLPKSTGFHYRQTLENTVLSPEEMCLELGEAWQDEGQDLWLATVATSITFRLIDVVGVTYPTVGRTIVTNVPGTRPLGGATLVPLRAAPVVNVPTAFRGRSYRGRSFQPPIPEADSDNSDVSVSYLQDLDDYLDAIKVLDPSSGNRYRVTVYSPTLSEGGPIVDNLVTDFVIRPRQGTQRRRDSVG